MLKTAQDRLRLSRGVGDELANEAKDVSAVAAALEHFGRFLPGRHGSPGGAGFKRELDGALRAFQRSFGLKADGRVLPGGPTQRTFNALLAGGLGALVPDETAVRSKRDFEARLKLRGSVGEGADSRREDREMVRLGLGVSGDLPPGAALDEALDDARLGEGIERMNRRFGFSGGRQLAPGSRGEALLASILKRTYGERLPEGAARGRTADARVADDRNDAPRIQLAHDIKTDEEGNERKPTPQELEDRGYPSTTIGLFDEREDRKRWTLEDEYFYTSLETILRVEAGWNEDAGGTWRGVTQDFYDLVKQQRGQTPTYGSWPRYVGNLSEDQVLAIYRWDFWRQPKLHRLLEVKGLTEAAPRFVEQVLDFGITSKPKLAISYLQKSINEVMVENDSSFEPLAEDGIIGSDTMAALKKVVELNLTVRVNNQLVENRLSFLRGRKKASANPGWIPRAESYRIIEDE